MLVKQVGGGGVAPQNVINNVHTPVAATAAVITLAAPGTNEVKRHVIHGIQWSYTAAPTGGRLTIVSTTGSVVELDIDITAAGPGALGTPISGVINSEVVITLASGAGGVVGKLNVQSITESA
jgi:hypothetical protein